DGRVDEASEVLGEMQRNGCFPNVVTYRMILDGFCRKGNLNRALEVLYGMVEKDLAPH
ncbi:hypothetical protein KI387_024408, partial [Taxus chinensis]